MDERASGLILRTRPLTETSLIVNWLTPDLGRLATVAKGALRPKSPLRGKLDLFYQANFSFARSRRGDLHTLREVEQTRTHPALRQDFDRLRIAAYAARLIEQTTETETPLSDVFALTLGLLEHLDTHPAAPTILFAFELKLLEISGLAPEPVSFLSESTPRPSPLSVRRGGVSPEESPHSESLNQPSPGLRPPSPHPMGRGQGEGHAIPIGLSPGTAKALTQLGRLDWEQLSRLKLSPGQTGEIDRFLRRHLIDTWERHPTGRAEALGRSD